MAEASCCSIRDCVGVGVTTGVLVGAGVGMPEVPIPPCGVGVGVGAVDVTVLTVVVGLGSDAGLSVPHATATVAKMANSPTKRTLYRIIENLRISSH